MILQILQEEGFHRKWSFLILASVWILGTVNTVFFLPRYKVARASPKSEAKVEMKKNALMVCSLTKLTMNQILIHKSTNVVSKTLPTKTFGHLSHKFQKLKRIYN